ncbi:Glutamyl-tRNA amidotransferase B subunit [Laetiporus sulphureus 93-53]|uniref:Glutamyl-tRNA(Gln) amidotransferase subunit B, mitochondrial n=1 Tax=Laetiporus sulphureus 93-53 TaxID=1314785 RepID=A0A165DSV3_9APHY|nr:Glutamyl-tRNA amidotransferase B subunit [Laetiporus sulphureus 93-53]KZT05563.1 Glutamyl-tRNA amidotransferase B subunit [Laetiporus sulphureus 93-53]
MLGHARVPWKLAPGVRCSRLAHTLRANHEDARWPGWNVVVGIEVHAQIKSRTKLFSSQYLCTPWTIVSTWTSDYSLPPNTRVSAYDAAFPGTLPRLNPKCVELGVRTAVALNAQVQRRSAFDRKHYFYADLPAGYQITQHYAPFATGGGLKLDRKDAFVRIKQIQLEQDTGKSTFEPRQHVSFIDLNRAGTGLMEIVSEPDMRSPEEAGEYVRALQALLRSVGSSDGNMEQGSLRCDVNVSVHRNGSPFGTRCEIKNLNSVKFMMVAITSEVRRQIDLLESGQSVAQETRGFNEDRAETYLLRSKEDAPDYRYMPDPNLPPLLIDEAYITQIRDKMPELPDATRARLQDIGLSRRDTDVLMDVDSGREVGLDGELGKGAVAYFDQVAQGRDPKVVVNWITHELLGQLAYRKETFSENPISAEQMGELIDLIQAGKMTGTSGKTLLRHMLDTRSSGEPSKLAEQLSLLAVREDNTSLEKWCTDAIAAMPQEAEAFRKGNMNVVNRMVGRVMKASRGTADARAVRDMLVKLLQ